MLAGVVIFHRRFSPAQAPRGLLSCCWGANSHNILYAVRISGRESELNLELRIKNVELNWNRGVVVKGQRNKGT